MTIRSAVVGDVPALAEVYRASLLAVYEGIATKDYLSKRDFSNCLDQWMRNVLDDAMSVVVAERESSIAGLSSFSRARDGDVNTKATGEIQAIYVSPDHWGQGIGSELCDYVLRRFHSLGLNSILLWVLADNVVATSFYRKLGFEPDGASKTVTMGRELLAVRYRLERPTAT